MNKTLISLLIGLTLAPAIHTQASTPTPPEDKLSISITNNYGDVFTNLTLVRIMGDGLLLEHKAGLLKVKFGDLPEQLREKYEPLAAGAEKKAVEEAKANAAFAAHMQQIGMEQARERAAMEQRARREAARLAMIRNENTVITIPDQSWHISILNPGLGRLYKGSSEGQFVCEGHGANGFNLSLFVESPAGGGALNDDVFNYYWPRASRHPLIDTESVRVERKDKWVKVSYRSLDIPNVNYYFAFKGKWVDVHISKSPFTKDDESLFADFESRLSYGE